MYITNKIQLKSYPDGHLLQLIVFYSKLIKSNIAILFVNLYVFLCHTKIW